VITQAVLEGRQFKYIFGPYYEIAIGDRERAVSVRIGYTGCCCTGWTGNSMEISVKLKEKELRNVLGAY
jgi:hypothetical protein